MNSAPLQKNDSHLTVQKKNYLHNGQETAVSGKHNINCYGGKKTQRQRKQNANDDAQSRTELASI